MSNIATRPRTKSRAENGATAQDVGARHKAGHDDREIVRQPDRNQL